MAYRKSLLAGFAAAVMSAAILVVAAPPAWSSTGPIGTAPVCDHETSPYQICLYVNGTEGHPVYGKYLNNTWAGEQTSVAPALVCNGTDAVDGGGGNCPFKVGSGLNAKYSGDIIVYMYNAYKNDMYYNLLTLYPANNGAMVQGSQPDGDLLVLDPDGSSYHIVNVTLSDSEGTSERVCSSGLDQPIAIQPTWAGGGACTWSFP